MTVWVCPGRMKLDAEGTYECSVTGLIFDVTKAVTINYSLLSWSKYAGLVEPPWVVGGPLFDVRCEAPSALTSIAFPHSLCLGGESCDAGGRAGPRCMCWRCHHVSPQMAAPIRPSRCCTSRVQVRPSSHPWTSRPRTCGGWSARCPLSGRSSAARSPCSTMVLSSSTRPSMTTPPCCSGSTWRRTTTPSSRLGSSWQVFSHRRLSVKGRIWYVSSCVGPPACWHVAMKSMKSENTSETCLPSKWGWGSSPEGSGHGLKLLELKECLDTGLRYRVWICVVICRTRSWTRLSLWVQGDILGKVTELRACTTCPLTNPFIDQHGKGQQLIALTSIWVVKPFWFHSCSVILFFLRNLRYPHKLCAQYGAFCKVCWVAFCRDGWRRTQGAMRSTVGCEYKFLYWQE